MWSSIIHCLWLFLATPSCLSLLNSVHHPLDTIYWMLAFPSTENPGGKSQVNSCHSSPDSFFPLFCRNEDQYSFWSKLFMSLHLEYNLNLKYNLSALLCAVYIFKYVNYIFILCILIKKSLKKSWYSSS
jgi:hypothetical protein